jgi:hypothetical protein
MAGDYGCGLWDTDYLAPPPTGSSAAPDTCDYPLTRPLALLVAAAAAEALTQQFITGSRMGFECTLRDLHLSAR